MAEKKKTTIEEQAVLFSVLGDPTRLKLLRLLSQQKEPDALCVNALAYRLGVTQPAVSQHLKLLKNAGFVQGEKRGYRVHYFVKREALDKAKKVIFKTLEFTQDQPSKESPGKTKNDSK
jgi:ArsR family transcriptional regulator